MVDLIATHESVVRLNITFNRLTIFLPFYSLDVTKSTPSRSFYIISSFLSWIDVDDKEIMILIYNFLYMLTLNRCRHRITKSKLHETITIRKSVKNRSYHYISISSLTSIQYQIEQQQTTIVFSLRNTENSILGVSLRHGPTHK